MTGYDDAGTHAGVAQAARDIAAFGFEHAKPGELLTTGLPLFRPSPIGETPVGGAG